MPLDHPSAGPGSGQQEPCPIRTDGSNAFARRTMEVRLPANIRNIAAADPDLHPELRSRVMELAAAIADGRTMPPVPPGWPDAGSWAALMEPFAGEGWLGTGWLFAETYAYRLVLDAVDWWSREVDPYGKFKEREVPAALTLLRHPAAPQATSSLAAALIRSLWGNLADVSFVAGAALELAQGTHEHLVINDIDAAVAAFQDTGGSVHLVLDNAGFELASDLELAHALCEAGFRVHLHAKHAPTYVSDATEQDILALLSAAAASESAQLRSWSATLQTLLDTRQLVLATNPWWLLPDFWCGLPAALGAELSRAAMVIVKGDLNYRRVVRDSIWPLSVGPLDAAGLRQVGSPLSDTPILLLRTCKSDTLAPAGSPRVSELDRGSLGWRTSGRYGVAQLIN